MVLLETLCGWRVPSGMMRVSGVVLRSSGVEVDE